MKKVILLLVIMLLAVFVKAQDSYTRPFAQAGVEFAGAYGYETPSYNFSGGLESSGKHYLTSASGSYNLARKIETGDGHQYQAGGSAFYRFSEHGFAGGGATWSKQITSQWSKERTQPFAGIGFENDQVRVVFTYTTGFDKRNGNKAVAGTGEVKLGKHLRLVETIGGGWFHATDEPNVHASGAYLIGGLKWLF